MSKKSRQRREVSGTPMPAAGASTPRARWDNELWLGLGLGFLILVFYANSFSAGLTLDNSVVIGLDPRLHAWDYEHLRLIFTKDYWWPVESDLYRPLTTLSYLFNYAVLGSGERVASYHVVNFLLHWANAWLVLVIVRRLSGRRDVAALAAALFAVHPVNVESVTNIVGRADLLATLSVLVGGWCYLRAAEVQGARRGWWLAGMGMAAFLGVLCKESAVMICAFVFLYDWLWRWPKLAGTGRERVAAAAREFGLKGYVALVPALALLGWVRYWFASTAPIVTQSFVDNPIVGATPFQGFMTAIGVIGRYLGLLVFPRTLSADYSYHQIPLFGETGNGGNDLWAWGSLGVVIALLIAAVWLRRRQPLLAWGILFFFLMLLPTSNLIVVIGSIMGERFLYLPSIGFCVLAALALCQVSKAVAKRFSAKQSPGSIYALWALPAVAIGLFGARTLARNADWQDNLSLWKSTIAASPSSLKSYKGYATALWDDGPRDEPAADAAIAQAEMGLAILDREKLSLEQQGDALFVDLGVYYRVKGKFLEDRGQREPARVFYQKAVDILLRAREVDREANEAWHAAALRRGRAPGEIIDVGNFHIYLQLGLAESLLGNWAECQAAGQWINHLVPDELSGYILVGNALASSGRAQDAAVPYLEVILLDPKNDEAWTSLMKVYDSLGLQPPPVRRQGDGYSLFADIPLVRQQINAAGAEVVKLFEAVNRHDEAQTLRDQFMQKYAIPQNVFSPK